MKKNVYFPYNSQNEALNEYNALRTELLESQKQRINLLTASIGFLSAVFAYLAKDKIILDYESTILISLTIIPCFYSYSTRIRERRISSFIGVFLKSVSPWSSLSHKDETKLKFIQRTSTTIILGFLLLDGLLISVPFNQQGFSCIYLSISIIVICINIASLFLTAFLKDFDSLYSSELQDQIDIESRLSSVNEQNNNVT